MIEFTRTALTRRCIVLALGALTLAARAQPVDVVVDPGHTPARPGARSADGRPEYGYNLTFTGRLVHVLTQRGLRVERSDAGAVEFGVKRGRKTVNIEAVETVDAS